MLGQTIGKYRIVRTLGAGGMGRVFVGEHELLGRTAAIKVLAEKLTGSRKAIERFFREAVATSQIKHPGIVTVYDYGFDATHGAYLVLELLEGETLHTRLERPGQLDLDRAVSIARQIANALMGAHGVGVVHRDLKPANIYLVPDEDVEDGERVKILDFGIAKLREGEGESLDLTTTGTILGTPIYMSPEQCRGAGPIGDRSDVYSLGCILFRMAAGQPPFVGGSAGELILAHCTADVPRLGFFRAAPAPLEALLSQMLAKEPGDRPDAEEVHSVLEKLGEMALDPTRVMDAATAVRRLPPDIDAEVDSKRDTEPKPRAGAAPITTLPPETAQPGVFTRGLANRPIRGFAAADGDDRSRRGWSRASIIGAAGAIAGLGVLLAILGLAGGDEPSTARAPAVDGGAVTTAMSEADAAPPAPPALDASPPEVIIDAAAPEAIIDAAPEIRRVVVRSRPSGASVRLSRRGAVRGKTPFVLERPAAELPMSLWLSRSGYRAEKVVIDGKSPERTVSLQKRARRPPPADDPLGTM